MFKAPPNELKKKKKKRKKTPQKDVKNADE